MCSRVTCPPLGQAALHKLAIGIGMRSGQALRLVHHLFRSNSMYAALRRELAT